MAVEQEQEQEQTYRSAWQSSPLAIITLDSGGRVRSCNPASERIFGCEQEQLAMQPLAELAQSLDSGALSQMLSEAQAGRIPPRQEIRFRRADGGEVVTGFSVAPARRSGEPMVCVLRDLSREKSFRPQLLHTERMASIGMVASVVAHELNNALAGALGCLQLLPPPADKSGQELLGSIAGELHRAAEIVRELKGYARVEDEMSERFSVADVITRVERLRRYHATSDRPATLEVELEPDLPLLEGNSNQMLQALLNLVRNAEQAVHELPDERRTIGVRARATPQVVIVEVSDRGAGVPVATRAQLFEPFYSTKAAGDGTGLGLTVVQAVAAGHGGRVEVDDTPGGGATFRLVLPFETTATTHPRPPTGTEEPVEYGRLDGTRILVADDEPLIRRVVLRCCRSQGAVLVEAEGADEAVQALAEQPFDLVLLDVRMPGGGGAEVFRVIRSQYPQLVTRTVFMSGDISQDMAELVGTGHAGILPKPFDLRELLGTLEGVLATVAESTPDGD